MPPDAVSLMLQMLTEQGAAIAELRRDVNKLQITLAEKAGERRVATWFFSAFAAAIGSFITLGVRWLFSGGHV